MTAALSLFLDGAPLSALAADTERVLRAELAEAREARAQMAQLLRAWDETCQLVGKLSMESRLAAVQRIESYHSDEWIHAYTMGEAQALSRSAELLALLANAMKLTEIGGVDGDE